MISTFWARRIRWGLRARITPAWWPVYVFLPATRRAFYHSFYGRGLYSPAVRHRRPTNHEIGRQER